MDKHTQNNGITPPDKDKTPTNTHPSGEYSADYNQKIIEALFPYGVKNQAVEITLNDNHGFILDGLINQIELLRDFACKIKGNEDINGVGLVGFSENLIRQLKVLEVVQGEYHKQVANKKEQQQKIIGGDS